MSGYPVDITKEEYVAFSLLISKFGGLLRFRRSQYAVVGAFGLYYVFTLLTAWIKTRTVSIPDVVMLTLTVLAMGFLMAILPLFVKNKANKQYDLTLSRGQSFYGHVFLQDDFIEKKSAHASVRIRYARQTMYIENRDMMIFLSPEKPAIVLPARCMTLEFSNLVRQIAMERVPIFRQKLLDRLVPMALQPIEQPIIEPEESDKELWKMQVEFTKDEFVSMAVESAERNFFHTLPTVLMMSLFIAFMISMILGIFIGLIVFQFSLVLIYGMNKLTVRWKSRASFDQLPEQSRKLAIRLTERGIEVRSALVSREVTLLWKYITRAIERREFVEFRTKSAVLMIPKRCIDNMNHFKEIVDRKMEENRKLSPTG